MKKLIPLFLLTLALAGCVSREQADEKLVRGCKAGVEAFLPEGHKISSVTAKTFGEDSDGPGLRAVHIKTMVNDGWIDEEKSYDCVFEETFGILNISHSAVLHRMTMDDKVYGKQGNEVVGTMDDFVKITDAVTAEMTKP